MKMSEKYLNYFKSEWDTSFFKLYFISHGFIFNDGSILDITDGIDHNIIDYNVWHTENIITYHFNPKESEIFLRLFKDRLNNKQLTKIKSIIKKYKIKYIIVDIQKPNLEIEKSKECDGLHSFINFIEKEIKI